MSGKRIHPRLEQVAELTRGHVLPQGAILDFHMEVIADCIAQEWNALVSRYPGQFPSTEVQTTSLLCSRLQNLANPLWTDLVSCVGRSEVISYDGSHLEKSPDLSICLTRPRSPFNLEVECKLIDYPARKTVGLYAKDGLARFLRGEYAWARREAFMLAYVRDGSAIDVRLTPFLAKHKNRATDRYSTEQLPSPVGTRTDLARSTHARSFSYPLQTPSSPGPIVIWHLWL
jgi:hypothetical protein